MPEHERIYLQPECCAGEEGRLWCQDDEPQSCPDGRKWTPYIFAGNLRERLFSGLEGCSDHNCIVTGHKSGIGTNGGCSCLNDASRTFINILHSRLQALLSETE